MCWGRNQINIKFKHIFFEVSLKHLKYLRYFHRRVMSAGFEDLLERVRRGGGGGGGGREEQREAVPWLQILLEMLTR